MFSNIASIRGSQLYVLIWQKWYTLPIYQKIKLNVRQLETRLPDLTNLDASLFYNLNAVSIESVKHSIPPVESPSILQVGVSTNIKQNLFYPNMSCHVPDDMVLDQEQ